MIVDALNWLAATPDHFIGFLTACFFLGGNFRSGGSVKVNTEPKT